MSQVRKAGKNLTVGGARSPGVDLAERGWGPTVVPGANVATLRPWVPESDWPLPLFQPMGWQNGGEMAQKWAWFKTPAIRVTVLALSTAVGSCRRLLPAAERRNFIAWRHKPG